MSKKGTYKLKCSTHKNNFGEFLPRYLKTSKVRKIDLVQDDSHLGLPTRFSDLDSKTGASLLESKPSSWTEHLCKFPLTVNKKINYCALSLSSLTTQTKLDAYGVFVIIQ